MMPLIAAFLERYVTILPTLVVIILITYLDRRTGINKAKFLGEEITSDGFGRTISKLFEYTLLIVLGVALYEYIQSIYEFEFLKKYPFMISHVYSIYVIEREYKSMCENIKVTRGIDLWEKTGQFFLLPKHALDLLAKRLKNIINKTLL